MNVSLQTVVLKSDEINRNLSTSSKTKTWFTQFNIHLYRTSTISLTCYSSTSVSIYKIKMFLAGV